MNEKYVLILTRCAEQNDEVKIDQAHRFRGRNVYRSFTGDAISVMHKMAWLQSRAASF